MHDPITVTVQEAKRVSGLGLTTLNERIANGELRSVKVGNRRLISMSSLRKLLGEAA